MSLPSLKQYHRGPYAAISPSRPELSQAGKTIVVTGGNSGIGFAIARGFIQASAKHVIILGRRQDVVKSAAEKLSKEADSFGSSTAVEGKVCDIASLESTEKFWEDLQSNGIFVDVLVLNAAAGGKATPILKNGLRNVWADYEANVRSTLDFTERFHKQIDKQGASSRKFLVYISTIAGYMWQSMAPERPTYGMTKNAATLLVQQIAKDTDVKDMQIVSFHPGGVLTDMARNSGASEDMGIPFDNENLPGQFAVWAASREAEHLHGRFVWGNWDVDEVKAVLGKQISEEPNFLKVGIEGLSESLPNPMLTPEVLQKIMEFQQRLHQAKN
ncbi:hypothetical protein GGI43DRAFT_248811 [Trichoderma evansii]